MGKTRKIGLNLVALRVQQASGVQTFVKNVLGRVCLGSEVESYGNCGRSEKIGGNCGWV